MNSYAIKLATRHLLSHPGQAALLMSGVALGVGVFIFMSALIGGLATLLTLRTVGTYPTSLSRCRIAIPTSSRLALGRKS